MTAACFKRKAWDGSPITCYCPVYRAERYMIGSSDCAQDSCAPNLPYIARCGVLRGRARHFKSHEPLSASVDCKLCEVK